MVHTPFVYKSAHTLLYKYDLEECSVHPENNMTLERLLDTEVNHSLLIEEWNNMTLPSALMELEMVYT